MRGLQGEILYLENLLHKSTQLEIVVHLLSADAAGIAPGTEARLDQWGGATLASVVDRVDPAAYTKVSALGIEEQRVDATLRLTDPYEIWRGLGHEFRVMAHIVTWRSADILSVPLGALFDAGKGPGRNPGGAGAANAPAPKASLGLVPLTELGEAKYKDQTGGLYGEGRNEPPASHFSLAQAETAKIAPLGGTPAVY